MHIVVVCACCVYVCVCVLLFLLICLHWGCFHAFCFLPFAFCHAAWLWVKFGNGAALILRVLKFFFFLSRLASHSLSREVRQRRRVCFCVFLLLCLRRLVDFSFFLFSFFFFVIPSSLFVYPPCVFFFYRRSRFGFYFTLFCGISCLIFAA